MLTDPNWSFSVEQMNKALIALLLIGCFLTEALGQQGWWTYETGYCQRQNSSLALDATGNVYFTWTSGNLCYLRKYSRFGSVTWTKTSPLPPEWANAVAHFSYVAIAPSGKVLWMYTVGNDVIETE